MQSEINHNQSNDTTPPPDYDEFRRVRVGGLRGLKQHLESLRINYDPIENKLRGVLNDIEEILFECDRLEADFGESVKWAQDISANLIAAQSAIATALALVGERETNDYRNSK